MRNFSASEQLFICRAQCYQRLTKFKHALDNLKKAKSELEEVYKATVHRTKRLCKDNAERDVKNGVDKRVDCTSKTRTVIGRFPIARTASGYENQILTGQIRERNVVRKKAAISGEERCVTSLKTAAKETSTMQSEGKMQTADSRWQAGGRMQCEGKMQTADCRVQINLQTEGKMQSEGKMETEDFFSIYRIISIKMEKH